MNGMLLLSGDFMPIFASLLASSFFYKINNDKRGNYTASST